MRIVLHNPFDPDRATAERELAQRMAIAGRRKGWTMAIAHTASEIEAFAPDLVVALHYEMPKLAGFPTVGCLWNPPVQFEDDPAALARVLSCDGFLCAGPAMERLAAAWLHPTQRFSPPGGTIFPSTHALALKPAIGPDSRLFYTGSGWDGRRFQALFDRLAEAEVLAAAGPGENWAHLGAAYVGALPFDGETLVTTANRQGLGLCLHLPDHTAAGLPNMRLFELAAAGTLIICDRHPFVEEHFGDCVLTVDGEPLAEIIIEKVRWARAHPDEANTLAARAQAIFLARFTLDGLLEGLPGVTDAIRRTCGYDRPPPAVPSVEAGEAVTFVLPVREDDAGAGARTIRSLSRQSYRPIRLIVTGRAAAIDATLAATGPTPTLRSLGMVHDGAIGSALSAALRIVDTPWFAVLEAGVELFPNHTASLVATARRDAAPVVFGHAVIRSDGRWAPAPIGALHRGEVPGDRLEIPVSAFLVRRRLLDPRRLRNPGLNEAAARHLIRRLVADNGAVSSWLTTLRDDARPIPVEERRALDRVERLDPALAPALAASVAPTGSRPAPPRPAPLDARGAAILDDVPLLWRHEDFAALDPTLPIYIHGASRGGRLVQLELMKIPDIRLVGFLDNRRSGEAWGFPVFAPSEVPPAMLAGATIIVASEHVVDIVTGLKALGRLKLVNAYPYIAAATAAARRR